jgi:uncharacterized membrane protein
MTRAAVVGWWLLLPCIILVGGWISLRNAHAFTFATDRGYLNAVGGIGRETWFRFGFFLHVFGAVPVVLIGWTQFSSTLLRDYRAWHRGLGKAYVLLVLLAAAPGGFLIGLGAAGGLAGKSCFVVMSLLWAWFTGRAWWRIHKRGDIAGHRADMRRSYALTFAAITLRIWMYLIGGLLEWHTPAAYALCAWLCWVPNLLLVELWLNRRR